MALTSEKIETVFRKNLDHVHIQASSAAEKSFAHLHEMASLISYKIRKTTEEEDLLYAVIHSDEAVSIYRNAFSETFSCSAFSPVNQEEECFFERQTLLRSRLYLCRSIAKTGKKHSFSDLSPLFFGTSSQGLEAHDRKVAFLRNHQAFRAFECFAKQLGGVSVLYENNFQNACEAVVLGQAAYAIIPVYSTSDGRLNSFYRMIEKHELSIAMVCDIDSDDGETVTTFALVSKERVCLEADGEKFECTITFENLADLADLADAAFYYHAHLDSLDALPVMLSGRAGTYSLLFDLKGADLDGLFCYLALEYPQMSIIGFYGKAEKL